MPYRPLHPVHSLSSCHTGHMPGPQLHRPSSHPKPCARLEYCLHIAWLPPALGSSRHPGAAPWVIPVSLLTCLWSVCPQVAEPHLLRCLWGCAWHVEGRRQVTHRFRLVASHRLSWCLCFLVLTVEPAHLRGWLEMRAECCFIKRRQGQETEGRGSEEGGSRTEGMASAQVPG